MALSYTAQDIADLIVQYSIKRKTPVTNIKLQKLLYLTWFDYHRYYGEEIFADEFQAWKFGPVVASVYGKYASFNGKDIDQPLETYAYDDLQYLQFKTLFKDIIDKYIDMPLKELIDITNFPGSPWSQVYGTKHGAVITRESIFNYKQSEMFFSFKECPHYPCHEMPNGGDINCMMCFCPLYYLKNNACGGVYTINNSNGVKDCSKCILVHGKTGYDFVTNKVRDIIRREERRREKARVKQLRLAKMREQKRIEKIARQEKARIKKEKSKEQQRLQLLKNQEQFLKNQG